MSHFHETATQWHTGEEQLHRLLKVPMQDNPTQPYLYPAAANLLIRCPLLALGTLDAEGKPWTSIWGGEPGFSRAIAQSTIGIKTTVDRSFDPVVGTLLGSKGDGEVVQEQGMGRMVSGLAIDLESRRRVKLYGRMVAGALQSTEKGLGEVQLVVKIEQSLGNCPKYLNKKHIVPHLPRPSLVSEKLHLSPAAVDLLEKADLFFISSSNHDLDMDTNHRGGPPGFVRILSNEPDQVTLVYPEYSGNRLYQTLGNLQTTPKAGLVFPNFDTGDVLYVTGRTEILAGAEAAKLIAHTNLAVKIQVDAVRFVSNGLAVRGEPGAFSPYNPPVRFLSTENRHQSLNSESQIQARLVTREILTPTIARFRFRISDPGSDTRWKPGQFVALGFEDELDFGYSHMRDDDPKSLNDDFVRTFTVSGPHATEADSTSNEFDITIRKVGVATNLLFKFNLRSQLDLNFKGFGGEFFLQQGQGELISFIAGGVGITPLLTQARDLDLGRLELYWTIRSEDIGFAVDTFSQVPGLASKTELFITGPAEKGDAEQWAKLRETAAQIQERRMEQDDLQTLDVQRWYVCTGTSFRRTLLEWLKTETVLYEDFNY
ncbi:oxidoreductase FAD-binding domain-containing protein [Phlyctema vagabunda]|uniref:Oxidoreductase FAD-binding domain-containing protein n=1 Tax=Phlyctema vagabunda TaxID=108571 RepID=A0ABR4PFG0_9HELO